MARSSRSSSPARLLVLSSYPESAAATRCRLTAYFPALRSRGIEPELRTFIPAEFASTYAKASGGRIAPVFAASLLRRARDAVLSGPWNAVLVHREGSMIGGGWVERALHDVRGLPLIFDLDDAVWLEQPGSRHRLAKLLRRPASTADILSRSSLTVAGSNYLAEHCRPRTSGEVIVLPTVVSSVDWAPLPGRLAGKFASTGHMPTIGWIGTPSTAAHLDLVLPALQRLHDEGSPFRMLLVGAARKLALDGVDVEYREWSREREIADFQHVDIGIAPVVDDEWSRGKCGFKAIQFMTVGVPFVASPVGGASEHVVHGDNGLLATTTSEWASGLRSLLENVALRAKIATRARALIEQRLCNEVQQDVFADAIRGVIDRASSAA